MSPPDPGYDAQRELMLREHLRRRGIRDPRVLEAMQRVPREQFVPADATDQAYADRALPIDCEQTISQPYIVALMTELLDLRGMEKVLEVGTGSGYQTAMLCVLAAEVVSIERHADLSQQARRKLDALGCSNAKLHVGDGTLGCPGEAPFDRVIVTAAAERVPPSLFSQLAEEGIMVIPVGGRAQQVLQAIRKRNGQAHVEHAVPCRFVPLVGSEGWPEPPGPDEPGEQEA